MSSRIGRNVLCSGCHRRWVGLGTPLCPDCSVQRRRWPSFDGYSSLFGGSSLLGRSPGHYSADVYGDSEDEEPTPRRYHRRVNVDTSPEPTDNTHMSSEPAAVEDASLEELDNLHVNMLQRESAVEEDVRAIRSHLQQLQAPLARLQQALAAARNASDEYNQARRRLQQSIPPEDMKQFTPEDACAQQEQVYTQLDDVMKQRSVVANPVQYVNTLLEQLSSCGPSSSSQSWPIESTTPDDMDLSNPPPTPSAAGPSSTSCPPSLTQDNSTNQDNVSLLKRRLRSWYVEDLEVKDAARFADAAATFVADSCLSPATHPLSLPSLLERPECRQLRVLVLCMYGPRECCHKVQSSVLRQLTPTANKLTKWSFRVVDSRELTPSKQHSLAEYMKEHNGKLPAISRDLMREAREELMAHDRHWVVEFVGCTSSLFGDVQEEAVHMDLATANVLYRSPEQQHLSKLRTAEDKLFELGRHATNLPAFPCSCKCYYQPNEQDIDLMQALAKDFGPRDRVTKDLYCESWCTMLSGFTLDRCVDTCLQRMAPCAQRHGIRLLSALSRCPSSLKLNHGEDKIAFLVCHKSHFVACALDLPARRMWVYNGMSADPEDAHNKFAIQVLREVIGLVLPDDDSFSGQMLSDPEQVDGDSCGALGLSWVRDFVHRGGKVDTPWCDGTEPFRLRLQFAHMASQDV